MTLADVLKPENIIPEMRSTDRWQAIDELIDRLVSTGSVNAEHREAIAAVVKKRETSMSTGIGFGIGIPHASTDLIPEVIGVRRRRHQSDSGHQGISAEKLSWTVEHLAPHFTGQG